MAWQVTVLAGKPDKGHLIQETYIAEVENQPLKVIHICCSACDHASMHTHTHALKEIKKKKNTNSLSPRYLEIVLLYTLCDTTAQVSCVCP